MNGGRIGICDRVKSGKRGAWDARPFGFGLVKSEVAPGAVVLRDDILLCVQTGEVYRDARFAPQANGSQA